MNYKRTLILAAAMIAMTAPLYADTGSTIRTIAAQTRGSVALVHCRFALESAASPVTAQAVCIDKSGLFVATGFRSSMRKAKVESCQLIVPGPATNQLDAKLTTIDRNTGLAFIQCTDAKAPKWQPVKFAERSNLSIGQQVVSVANMPGDPASNPAFGVAYVSAIMRAPDMLVYVTGGTLTQAGSPVFNARGQAIGLIWRQLPDAVELRSSSGRPARAQLQSHLHSTFFTPVEEFVYAIEARGKEEQSWTGVARFQPADKAILGLKKPGVRVGKVVPGYAAAKAGLKDLDVIVAVDNQDLEELATPALTAMNLERKLLRMKVGQKVTFTLQNGKQVPIALEAMPERFNETAQYLNIRAGLVVRRKMEVENQLAGPGPVRDTPGLVVLNVIRKETPAAKAGLRVGDLITKVGDTPVSDVEAFKTAMDKAAPGDDAATITLTVIQRSEVKTVKLELPKRKTRGK